VLSRLALRVLHNVPLQYLEVKTFKAVHFDLDNVLVVVKLSDKDAICVDLSVRNALAPRIPHYFKELLCNHSDVVLAQVASLLANEWQ